MTEKRFTIDKDEITVIDNCTNGLTECKHSQEAKLLCNFLNEVTEENEQLKNMCENLVNSDSRREYKLKQKIKELSEENEELKQENKKLHDTIFALRTENAYDRATEITKQKNINVREFLEELDRW